MPSEVEPRNMSDSKIEEIKMSPSTAKARVQWHQATRMLNSQARQEVTNGKILPKWVPDKESKGCMICSTNFGIATRRHHCRNCGFLVCANCSDHTVVVPYDAYQDPVRVCDHCFKVLNDKPEPQYSSSNSVSSTSPRPGSGARSAASKKDGEKKRALDADAVNEDFRSTRHANRLMDTPLPNWLYMFKPFSNHGQNVGIGRLYIRVIEAENLPAMDFLGTSDPYVVAKLKEEEELYEELQKKQFDANRLKPEVARTRVIEKTLNPRWDEEFILNVHNATYTLRLDLFDQDSVGNDEHMGHVEIPLSELSHQRPVNEWFEVTLNSNAISEHEENSKGMGGKLTSTGANLVVSALSLGLVNMKDRPNTKAKSPGHAAVTNESKEAGLSSKSVLHTGQHSRVRLEVLYRFSKFGEFMSHFNIKKPAPVPQEDFNVDSLLGQGMRLIGLLGPLFAFFISVNLVLSWQQPALSMTVLLAFIFFCFNSWLFPVLLQLLLIYHITWQYVYREWRKAESWDKDVAVLGDENNVASSISIAPVSSSASSAAASTAAAVDPSNANPQQYLNSTLRGFLNTSLSAAGWREYLHYYQNLLKWVCDMIEYVQSLFAWKYPSTTRAILFILIASTLYSIYFTFAHVFLVAGVYVLTMWTVPSQLFMWLLFGLIRYLSRPSVKQSSKTRKAWHTTVNAVTTLQQHQHEVSKRDTIPDALEAKYEEATPIKPTGGPAHPASSIIAENGSAKRTNTWSIAAVAASKKMA